jgi:tripartite-type tricarboxylate transporter receptor subunit TctC
MPMTSRLCTNAALLAGVLLASPPAFSQAWPAKPVRIIVPAAAGTTQDILTEEFDRFIREQIKTLAELVAYLELKPE